MTAELEDVELAWIELHQSVRDHHKIMDLADSLRIEEAHAIGLCASLWLWAVDNAPDGKLPSSPRHIARAAKWHADPSQLVVALTCCGLVDCVGDNPDDADYFIHDWQDFAGKLIERRKANAQRMRDARAMNVPNTSAERARSDDAHVLGDSTVQNRTQQNSTKIIPLNPPSGDAKKPRKKPQKPIPEDWAVDKKGVEYAKEYGMSDRDIDLEAEKFFNYWEGKGEIRADWAATWRTWVNNWATYRRQAR
jgi:hypothetical protein